MKIVNIVGKAAGYEKVYEEEGEVWTVSSAYKLLKCRVDLVFELHREKYWAPWLKEIRGKLLTADPPDNFECRRFPTEEMIKIYGPKFGGSIPWMIGYALWQGYDRINIFGVHMNAQGEYGIQRDSTFYMIGQAEGRGVEVHIPEDSPLNLNQLYGR